MNNTKCLVVWQSWYAVGLLNAETYNCMHSHPYFLWKNWPVPFQENGNLKRPGILDTPERIPQELPDSKSTTGLLITFDMCETSALALGSLQTLLINWRVTLTSHRRYIISRRPWFQFGLRYSFLHLDLHIHHLPIHRHHTYIVCRPN